MKEATHSKRLQRPKLTRERIFEVAMHIAQDQGIESVSMRRVAKELNIEAMSLYKHVENKDDLIDGIIELIMKQIKLPNSNTDWKQALLERASSEYKVLSANSWITHLLEARSGTGEIRLAQQNHMIGILRRSGFSINLAFQTMIIVTGYVYGFVVFARAWNSKSKERTKTIKKAQIEIKPETHPYVMEAILYAQSKAADKKNKSESEFDLGLRLILDGVEKQLQLQK